MGEHKCEHEKEFDELWKKLDKHDNFLYIDGSKPCVQTTQDRHNRIINVVLWLVTVTTSSVIGMLIRTIFMAMADKN